jgi:hypothetical protein
MTCDQSIKANVNAHYYMDDFLKEKYSKLKLQIECNRIKSNYLIT